MLGRAEIIGRLRDATAAVEAARAAWLGGSDATGRTDALSDIDLVVAATEEGPVFAGVEAALEAMGGIELRLELPSPTWHGHEQRFYRLRGAAPELVIDLVVMKTSAPEASRFLEPERHGRALVLFDKDGWIRPVALDRAAHEQKMRARLEALKARVGLFRVLITKALARGQAIDAAAFYHGFALLPVVEALRMLHCPDRFDFGLRYIEDDLPKEAAAVVKRLCYSGAPAELAEREREANRVFWETVARLEARRGAGDQPMGPGMRGQG